MDDSSDYYQCLKDLREAARKAEAILNRKYALSTKRFNIGDTLRSNSGTVIVVESLKFYVPRTGTPYCVYCGPKLTTKGVPYKSGETDIIYDTANNSIGVTKI